MGQKKNDIYASNVASKEEEKKLMIPRHSSRSNRTAVAAAAAVAAVTRPDECEEAMLRTEMKSSSDSIESAVRQICINDQACFRFYVSFSFLAYSSSATMADVTVATGPRQLPDRRVSLIVGFKLVGHHMSPSGRHLDLCHADPPTIDGIDG